MNLSWIANPFTMYAAVAAGGVAGLSLVLTIKQELALERKRSAAECEELGRRVEEVAAKVAEMALQLRERAAVPSRTPAEGLNMDKRSEALRMYRRGSDARAVASALNIPEAEVALLEKVHRILAAEVAAADQASGIRVQQRSSKLEYSPEA